MIETRFNKWLKNVKDDELKKELLSMTEEEKMNAFFKELSFGTAGLRGVLGAGSNCMNIYTVDKATEGVAQVLSEKGAKRVVVCYDSRNKSRLFAERVSSVFAFYNIEVFITQDIMPVSFLSYSVRYLKADAGIMITASHNPAKYNGYKVYESTGYQCTDESADIYAKRIAERDEFSVPHADFETELAKGKIKYVGKDVEKAYFDEVYALDYCSIEGFTVVYSPLNGAGYKVVPQVLEQKGAKVELVPEQSMPDGNFPTCAYPNPEKLETLHLAIELAKQKQSNLVIATDPDCDRVGIAVNHNGNYVPLTGNEVGALLADFVLQKRTPPVNFYKTIVSSDLSQDVAKKYGATTKEILTGFKYIGEQIAILEKDGKENQFALGYEESYGYLLTPAFRDKDGVGTCYVICQMVNYYLQQNKTLVDRLNELYDEFGQYYHKTLSFEFPGAKGSEQMATLLANLRKYPLQKIGDKNVVKVIDYLRDETGLPKADVLSYYLDGAKVIVRPSGTEPLIKVYLTVVGKDVDVQAKALQNAVAELMKG